ncbi:UNVERIFIED_ORG: hypothetical protein J2W85_005115 [Ensifer adhaerens]|nr:hypothetical protein [Ensifer adhaerens]
MRLEQFGLEHEIFIDEKIGSLRSTGCPTVVLTFTATGTL